MTKEEQIEEIAKDIAGIEQQEDLTLGEVYGIEATFELAEILCDAGYRKAEEIRKETAREILDKILKVIEFEASLDDKNATFNLCSEVVKDVIGEYGVDVGDSEEFDGPDTNDPTQFPACGDDMIGF